MESENQGLIMVVLCSDCDIWQIIYPYNPHFSYLWKRSYNISWLIGLHYRTYTQVESRGKKRINKEMYTPLICGKGCQI